MKKIISALCTISILFSTASALVRYEIPIREEKIIPINFLSPEDETFEKIDLSEYVDVKVVDYEMNKGKVILDVVEDELVLDLYDGKYFDGETVQENIKTEKICDAVEKSEKVIFTPEEDIKKIIDISGDFEAGKIEKGKVILELKKDAEGKFGFDKDKIVKSTMEIGVEKDNSKKTVYSTYYKIEEEMPDNAKIKVKNVNLRGEANLEVDEDEIRVLFDNGIPQINETSKTDGYGYFWVDRAIDGSFRTEYPNSIYRSDKLYFEGEGKYISDERLIIERDFEKEWKDFVGFELEGKKYVYILSDISKKLFDDYIILDDKINNFKGSWMNTDELKVEITEDSVRYIPEGNLYSMGELVDNTEGWGEIAPNRNDESKETFFNPISGKVETYVKHFKFFYGPKTKKTFGGNVKYPYQATVEYEHYAPAKLYSGNITYTYEEMIKDRVYEFAGWVKISYQSKKMIDDYPPSPPYNVTYNKTNCTLVWSPAADDYTKTEEMCYEVEVEIDGLYKPLDITQNGETTLNYEEHSENNFRVRAIDNQNQTSEWAYSDDSMITITGEVIPSEIFVGDSIDISATVRSFCNVKSVQAISEELNINRELIKKSESMPKAIEVTFNLLNHEGKKRWLIADDMAYANVNSENIKVKSYVSDAEEESSKIDVELPSNILFTSSGTVILPNQNYLDIPVEITMVDEKLWYFYSMCALNFNNKNTGQKESIIRFVNDTEASLVGKKEKIEVTPYIDVNQFTYENGKAIYKRIPVSSKIATKPIALCWHTFDGIIKFTIYIDGEYFYSYEVDEEKVVNNIEAFSSYTLGKRMERMLKNSVGYQYHYSSKTYKWSDMYLSDYLLDIPYLGYKIKPRTEDEVYEEYNNLPTTRDVNRLVFLDKQISKEAINLYLSKIKNTNMMINWRNKDTVFADEICEKTSDYFINEIKIDEKVEEGIYDITLIAVDDNGGIAKTTIPLLVKKSKRPVVQMDDIEIGRFFHTNNNVNEKYVEELSTTKYNQNTKGFICAGETLAIVINSEEEIKKITVDFIGDKSIKEYDKLTQKFLGNSISKEFPLTLYPIGDNVFLYTIPYGAKQTLESWATLREKSGDYESIDKEKLFSRIKNPYQIKIKVNGEEFVLEFDVFERWDTILNRDASKYITNSKQKWRIRL